MLSKIIAVSGRKYSGKTSLCNYISAYLAANDHNTNYAGSPAGQGEGALPYITFIQSPMGNILWREPFEGGYRSMDADEVSFLQLNRASNIYSFADSLKKVCVEVLGLTHQQVWGTEEEKNSLTRFQWENLPGFVRFANMNPPFQNIKSERDWLKTGLLVKDFNVGRTGAMTAREVMQVFATDIMRNMFYQDVWVDSTMRAIKRDGEKYALIADMRFKGELKAVQDQNGYIIRLERAVFKDSHVSERDLDDVDWRNVPRSLVIPASYDLNTKNEIAINWLEEHVFKSR